MPNRPTPLLPAPSGRLGRLGRLVLPLAAAFACTPLAAQDEVPFITTPDQVTLTMLDMAGVGPQDHLVDLGSGDGRIVITAAKRFGASGLGVEIVPELVQRSLAHARAAGVQDRAQFRVQDLFATDLSRATVVTLYLLPSLNLQLRPRLLALPAGTRIVSHDWDMGDWLPDQTRSVDVPDKAVGRDKFSRVHLWQVPAPVQGLWCSGLASLQIDQRFQAFSATLQALPGAAAGGVVVATVPPPRVFDGRIAGARGQAVAPGTEAFDWQPGAAGQPPRLRLSGLGVAAQALAEQDFRPAGPGGCG